MTFNEIAQELLHNENCSVLIKNENGQFLFYQDLHREVRLTAGLVSKVRQSGVNPSESEQCKAYKANLLYILENFNKVRYGAPNRKWTKR